MHEDYVETVEACPVSGPSRTLRYQPSKMHPYALAKAIKFGLPEDISIYQDIFAEKTEGAILAAMNSRPVLEKPSKEEKLEFKDNKRIVKDIWRMSSAYFARKILNSKRYICPTAFSETYGERILNQMIFSDRLNNIVQGYVFGGHLNNVLGDLRLVSGVVSDSSRFSELEKLCEGPLYSFIHSQKIYGMDEESQLQEGRMVIWNCASKYSGKNFARFNSLVRASLRNKAIDLSKYFSTQKRKAWKKTFLMGTGNGDSRLKECLDDAIYRKWKSGEENEKADLGYSQLGSFAKPSSVHWSRENHLVLVGTWEDVPNEEFFLEEDSAVEMISGKKKVVGNGVV